MAERQVGGGNSLELGCTCPVVDTSLPEPDGVAFSTKPYKAACLDEAVGPGRRTAGRWSNARGRSTRCFSYVHLPIVVYFEHAIDKGRERLARDLSKRPE